MVPSASESAPPTRALTGPARVASTRLDRYASLCVLKRGAVVRSRVHPLEGEALAAGARFEASLRSLEA
jgi:hypothetical protein